MIFFIDIEKVMMKIKATAKLLNNVKKSYIGRSKYVAEKDFLEETFWWKKHNMWTIQLANQNFIENMIFLIDIEKQMMKIEIIQNNIEDIKNLEIKTK